MLSLIIFRFLVSVCPCVRVLICPTDLVNLILNMSLFNFAFQPSKTLVTAWKGMVISAPWGSWVQFTNYPFREEAKGTESLFLIFIAFAEMPQKPYFHISGAVKTSSECYSDKASVRFCSFICASYTPARGQEADQLFSLPYAFGAWNMNLAPLSLMFPSLWDDMFYS